MLKATVALLATMLLTSAAQAVPITYNFSGQMSGSLSGTSFNLADVSFSLTSDTATVFRPTPTIRPTLYNSRPGVLQYTINGTTGTFDTLFNAFSITIFNGDSLVGLTEQDSNDIFDVNDPSLRGYDLRTSFAPVANTPLDFLNFDTTFMTSAGDLILFDDDGATLAFSAVTVFDVPEPTSWVLMIGSLGLAGVVLRRRTIRG